MPRIATRHAHKLAYRQRFSLGVRMLGCLVMLAGAMLLAAALAEVVKGSHSKSVWVMLSLGLVLVAGGTPLFLGERGKLIDREARTLTCWRGAFWRLFRTHYDLQPYQAVGVQRHDDAGQSRWSVELWNAQGERLEVFDLASEEAAQVGARQVARFLSLMIAPPPATALVPTTEPVASAVPISENAAAPAPDDRWTYRPGFGRPIRLLGVVLLALGGMLLLGILVAALANGGRGLPGLLAAAVGLLPGLWFVVGGRRVEIDISQQTLVAWRAWPLPPARYELAGFGAVIVAPITTSDASEQTAPPYLVGLVGPNQLRVEVMNAAPRDDAFAVASQLATLVKLPLINESQPLAAATSARVGG
jgi:hypothetical protein